MPDGAALDRYLEARSAVAERASDRAGLAACHELTDTLDEGLAALAAGLHGVAGVAVGGYGRGGPRRGPVGGRNTRKASQTFQVSLC